MVSVLMPVLKYSDYIATAIESVVNQTYSDWELIIGVNDNMAKYNTFWTAIEKLEIFDIKIIYFNCDNREDALNILCKQSKYDWIAIKDADDSWEYTKLKQQMYIGSSLEYKIIGSKIKYRNDKSYIRPVPCRDITTHNFMASNPINSSTVIIHKSAKPVWSLGIKDHELWIKMWKLGHKFYNMESAYVIIL